MDIDFNDPAIAELIKAKAAEKGCSPEELRAAVEAAHNLPPLFDSDPLKNLDGVNEFMSSVPWERVEIARQRMIEADPSKANWTKKDVLIKLIKDQVRREMDILPKKIRLEKLFEKNAEDRD